jgi:tol-pal system protein YbgF
MTHIRHVVRFSLCAAFLAIIPASGWAQDDQTLADIRQELSVLYYDIQALKRELSTSQSPTGADQSGSFYDRVGSIELQLQQLTAQVEELDYRVKRIVSDGTNRIGDLEFRLVELEGGDLGALAATTTLGGANAEGTDKSGTAQSGLGNSDTSGVLAGGVGGGNATATGATGDGAGSTAGTTLTQPDWENATQQGNPESQGQSETPQLAVAEQADYDDAQAALGAGNADRAIELLARFPDFYPGSPLTPNVSLTLGQAYEAKGDIKDAARAYLDSFVADGTGATAPEALLRLGLALGGLGQVQQACLTLGEVPARFPVSSQVPAATAELARLNCS